MDPTNVDYSRGMRHRAALAMEMTEFAQGSMDLENSEAIFITLAEDKPSNYSKAM